MKHLFVFALALAPLTVLAKAETWKVDTINSKIGWKATKIGGGHHGDVKVKSGTLTTEKGALKAGEIVVDMNTIEIADDLGEAMKTKLHNHLRSDDFFSVEKNPTSTLKIKKVGPAKDGTNEVIADLTIKGITKPVTFPATVKIEGNKLNAKAKFAIDRTAYDIRYRSLKFFADLGDKVIHDKFTLDVDLNASK
jgi:polyisoprenoid-binding protein YceI